MKFHFKTLCFALSLLMLVPAFFVCSAAESVSWGATTGDTDGNGSLDAKDYMILKRYILGTYELDWLSEYRADVNLDSKVGAVDYLYLKRIILGNAELPQIQFTDSIDTLPDRELKKYVNKRLANNRRQGELIVYFEDGADMQTVQAVFASLGLPEDLGDQSVYLDSSDADDLSQPKKLWFLICVSESEIRDVMFALHRNEAVSNVYPHYLGSWQ